MRRLDRYVVTDAVARIQIETRRRLKASAQRDQKALCHVALCEPDGLRASTIDVHGEVGQVERLLNTRVRCAGYVATLIQLLPGKRAIAI